MKKVLLGVSMLALSASAAFAQGQSQGDIPPYTAEIGPRQGDWEAFVGGTGTSNGEFNDNAMGVTGSIGYYALKWLPVSLRQSYVSRFGSRVNDRHDFADHGRRGFPGTARSLATVHRRRRRVFIRASRIRVSPVRRVASRFTSTKAPSLKGACDMAGSSTRISTGITAEPSTPSAPASTSEQFEGFP